MQLIESIRFEDGVLKNILYHQNRMNNSRKELFGCRDEINLGGEITLRSSGFEIRMQNDVDLQSTKIGIKNSDTHNYQVTNLKGQKGLFKCRIIYLKQIEEIEYIPYQLPKIKTLKIVRDNTIDYPHKFVDRTQLDKLYQRKENCDDILIVKNGLFTDTWFANILFYDGENWVTPENPLLKGTQRQFLLDQKKIETAEIKLEDLKSYKKARLINAMIRFEDELDVDILNIYK